MNELNLDDDEMIKVEQATDLAPRLESDDDSGYKAGDIESDEGY